MPLQCGVLESVTRRDISIVPSVVVRALQASNQSGVEMPLGSLH